MFAGTQIPESELAGKTSSHERMIQSYRNGHHATVYDVRRDPSLADKNIIRDKKKVVFPFVGGTSYKGQWRDDMREGFGTEVNPDGTKYEGEWSNNKKNGKGTIFVKQGKRSVRTYVGSWLDGYMNGNGVYYYPNGDIYRGNWNRNKRSGQGRIDYKSGGYYDGEWSNDKKNGFGKLFISNGNTYEGMWLDDKKEGPGRFFYAATGKVYEGEWADDQPRCGEFREPKGEEYNNFSEANVRTQKFDLPQIELENTREVLDKAVTAVRQENSSRRGISSGVTLSSEKLEQLQSLFTQVDVNNIGVVALQALDPLFEKLGLPCILTDQACMTLFTELDITLDTEISFPEAVDIAQYMLSAF